MGQQNTHKEVGRSVMRKESWNKVSGSVKYNNDAVGAEYLHARLVTSGKAHARIVAIHRSGAEAVSGVRAVITGEDTRALCGEVLEDRPPLARGKVRYYGEPVAIVVADTEGAAARGARAVAVEYDDLPVVNTPRDAVEDGAPLVHENLATYKVVQLPCYPDPGTNIADRAHIRKGDMGQGWAGSDVTVSLEFTLPQVDHGAMETRSARAQIMKDGHVIIHTNSQAPFEVQRMMSRYFGLSLGKVIVHTPLIGGAFGGKASVFLEPLAYMASKAVGGRLVKLALPREQDIASAPVGHGLEGRISLGATRGGQILAAEMTYYIDAGAYTDSAPRVARAIAAGCTGPYAIPNVHCDVYCVYTNHIYTTAYRGFGYMPLTFPVERAVNKLADVLGMDPLQIRELNAIGPGYTTPTEARLTDSNIGDLRACIQKVRNLMEQPPSRSPVTRAKLTASPKGSGSAGEGNNSAGATPGPRKIRAVGTAYFWKNSSSPPDALSGAIITFNSDGSANLSIGAVDFGSGVKTGAAQILAQRLGLPTDDIHVYLGVNTRMFPEHWKTVASLSTFMVGRAVLEAAEDALHQLKSIAAIALRCSPGDLEVGQGSVYLKADPHRRVALKDIAHGCTHAGVDAIGGQIIGRGSFSIRHLAPLDQDTGRGEPGPSWTVGVQAVEVELDTRYFTYRIIRAVTVMDAGQIINPKIARGMVMGGMGMGLSFGSREAIMFGDDGQVLNDQLRLYKMMRPGEEPVYEVDWVETVQADGPYGARPLGEHGVIGMPAALANALSAAAGVELNRLPVTPEEIWRRVNADARDQTAAPEPEWSPALDPPAVPPTPVPVGISAVMGVPGLPGAWGDPGSPVPALTSGAFGEDGGPVDGREDAGGGWTGTEDSGAHGHGEEPTSSGKGGTTP